MDVKISELEPVDSLFGGCCFPLVQNEETRKVTYETIKNQLKEDIALESYSTEEQVVGTWIDGKPICRKVVIINSFPNNERVTIPIDIQNVDDLITARGMMKNAVEYDTLPSAYTNGVLIDSLVIERSGSTLTNIRLLTNVNRSSFSGFVLLEYTKTTNGEEV